jgi:hypothetical protein
VCRWLTVYCIADTRYRVPGRMTVLMPPLPLMNLTVITCWQHRSMLIVL